MRVIKQIEALRRANAPDKLRFVHTLPTIDAVEVVRCKDCKWRGTSYGCPLRHLVFTEAEGYHYVDATMDDGYCYLGASKEVEK